MLYWMRWRRSSRIVLERWRTREMLQERNITITQCDGQHLKMMMRIITQTFFLNRITIHFRRARILQPGMIIEPILIPSPMITPKTMEIRWEQNHSKIPSGSQGNSISRGIDMLLIRKQYCNCCPNSQTRWVYNV